MTTYYATSAAGGGGVGSLVDPWTAQEAADNTTAGDECRWCGDFSVSAQIDFDTRSGSRGAPVKHLGYNAAGDTPTLITIDQTGDVNPFYIYGRDFLYFENLKWTQSGGVTGSGYIRSTLRCIFVNFHVDGLYSHGLYFRDSYDNKFENCSVLNGGHTSSHYGILLRGSVAAGGYSGTGNVFHGCVIADNYGDGIHCYDSIYPADVILSRCLIFNNGGVGVHCRAYDKRPVLIDHCVIRNNTGDGIYMENSANANPIRVANCAIVANGGYGINSNYAANAHILMFGTLCPASGDDANTSGATNNIVIVGDSLAANNTTSGTANFTSVGAGTEDFRTEAGSWLRDAAWPGHLPYGTDPENSM